ncbi:MAG: hypothetical protein ACOY3P_20355 [Planctomycetota bacterium]
MATFAFITQTGLQEVLHAELRDAAEQPYNQDSEEFEVFDSDNQDDYEFGAVEQGDRGYYVVALPDDIAPGRYRITVHESGVAFLIETVYWDGVGFWPLPAPDNTTLAQAAADAADAKTAAEAVVASHLGDGSVSNRVYVSAGGLPQDGVLVELSTDSAKANVVWRGYTTATGYTATIMLDPGTYYAWRQRSGVAFTNPETFTVT